MSPVSLHRNKYLRAPLLFRWKALSPTHYTQSLWCLFMLKEMDHSSLRKAGQVSNNADIQKWRSIIYYTLVCWGWTESLKTSIVVLRTSGYCEESSGYWSNHKYTQCSLGSCWGQRQRVHCHLRPWSWWWTRCGETSYYCLQTKSCHLCFKILSAWKKNPWSVNVLYVSSRMCSLITHFFLHVLQEQISGSTTSTILKNLEPDTKYTVTVVPVYHEMEGKPLSENGKTSKS